MCLITESLRMKKVTISFPVYNVEKTIEKSLLSALNQTYDNIELLAIDDKGHDGSMSILKKIKDTHPRGGVIRIVEHDKNKGLGSVRNTSIDNATGDYIYFMDSDDLLYDDTIAHMVSLIEKFHTDFVTASYIEVRGEEEIPHQYGNTKKVEADDIIIQQYRGEPVFVFMWNKLIRIDCLREKNIRCVHSYVEDDMFTFMLLCNTHSYCKSDKITYKYIIRMDSITNELMSNNLPLNTANIYADIIRLKLEYANNIKNVHEASLISIYVLNSAFLRLYQIDNSSAIEDKEKIDIERKIIQLIDRRNLHVSKKNMSVAAFVKIIQIYLSTLLSFSLKRKYILFIQKLKL